MRKLEHAGVKTQRVGLVVPTGYSFNLDGAAIYLSLAAVYIAQATDTDLTMGQQLGLLAVMLLTSKGAAGVAGGGFIALAATLTTIGTIPRRRHHADLRHRQVHVRVPRPGQLHRQRRGHAVHRLVGPGLDSDRVRRVLDREPVPALPAELDATTNPLAVESTVLDDEYHPHLHHEHHAPAPRYRVDDEVRRLGPEAHTHPAPVVGDAAEPSPVLAGPPQPDGDPIVTPPPDRIPVLTPRRSAHRRHRRRHRRSP